MNQNQKESILNIISSIESFNMDDELYENFENDDVSDIVFNVNGIEISGEFLSRRFNYIVNVIKEAFEDEEEFIFLPIQFSIGQNNLNIQGLLQNLLNSLKQRNFNAITNQLNSIYFYVLLFQLEKYLPDKKSIKENLKEEENKIYDLKKSIEAESKKVKEIKTRLTNKENEINSFYEEKKKELETIENNLESTSNKKQEVDDLWQSASSQKQEIDSIKKNYEQSLSEHRSQSKTMRDDYKGLLDELNEKLKYINKEKESIDEALTYFENKKEFAEEEADRISTLTEFVAGASLADTFSKRSERLKLSVRFWFVSIIFISIITIFWIYVVLVNYFDFQYQANEFSQFFLKSLKISPAFLLLGFAIRQYNKERNLEEEYSFKSSVALTVQSYLNMLENSDENEDQKQFILNTVLGNIYSKPGGLRKNTEGEKENKSPFKVFKKNKGESTQSPSSE